MQSYSEGTRITEVKDFGKSSFDLGQLFFCYNVLDNTHKSFVPAATF